MLKGPLAIGMVALAVAACSPKPGAGSSESMIPVAQIPARAETEGSLEDDGNDVALWLHPADPARSLALASGGTAGLELFTLDGKRVGGYTDAEIDYVAVSYGFEPGGAGVALVVAYDRVARGLLAFTINPDTLAVTRVTPDVLGTAGEVTGLCTYRSAVTGEHYAFAAVNGSVEQWKLFADGAAVRGQLVRTIPVGVGAGYCATDAPSASLFVTEETVGIWRIAAEPETDAVREAVDLVAPFGHLTEEVKGLAVYRADESTAYLLAADVAAGRFNVYALADDRYVGSFQLAAAGSVDATAESEGLAALAFGGLADSPGGLLAVFDEDNEGTPANIKLVPWQTIAAALKLAAATAADPRTPAAPSMRTVKATVETQPVEDFGDAADDPAIWVDAANPARSVIIGTNKKRGLDVYDLAGRRIQSLPDGRMNNVDIRDGLIAASNRTTKSIALYRIDPATRRLVAVADGLQPTEMSDPYGLCMYRSAKTGDTYVFVNDSADGTFRQWRLVAVGDKVRAEPVRTFTVGTQAEGCVADDETGALYIAEEDVGLWRYSAEPDGGTDRRAIDATAPNGRLTADVEGVGLFRGKDGAGFLVVSNQGANDYAVYRREGDNAFVGFFAITANDTAGIDGASETDGLEVTSAALGPAFPQGVLVVQDGRNLTPDAPQNFKLVPWERVAAALTLP